MPLDVRIISQGTTYYLVNSSGVPTAGGAATGVSTTPYSLNVREWTLTAAPGSPIVSGGPPFRIGSELIMRGYDTVTETITVNIAASSNDNAVALLQQLRRILNPAVVGVPALLFWQPNTGTNPVYFEILAADVQELGRQQNIALGYTNVQCQVTWLRSPFGGRITTPETLASGVVFNNGGASGNVITLSAGAGELANEGQPLNMRYLNNTGTADTGALWVASIHDRRRDTSSGTLATSSTTGVLGAITASDDIATAFTRRGLKLRLFVMATVSSNAQCRIEVYGNGATSFTPLIVSPWYGSTGGVAALLDSGAVNLWPLMRRTIGSSANYFILAYLRYRSTDGLSSSVTVGGETQRLLYYDLAVLNLTRSVTIGTGTHQVALDCFPEASGVALLPYQPRGVLLGSSSPSPQSGPVELRGTAPRYFSGCNLWLAWNRPNGSYNPADTGLVTVTHAPLYRTLRGVG
jgi:hypothetical protein